MNLANFLNMIKTSPIEKFGVVYHGTDSKTCVGAKLIATGNHGSIRGISLESVLDEAYKLSARAITLVHNHPNTEQAHLRPSEADLRTTFTIADAAKKDGIIVLNHIIYGANNSAFSFIHNGIEI